MKTLRLFLIWFFVPTMILSTVLQCGIQVFGNQSLPSDSFWGQSAAWSIALLFVLVPFGLWLMLLNGRRTFKRHFWGMAALCLLFAVPADLTNLYFLRAGFERQMVAEDQTTESNAQLVEWMETKDELIVEVERAQQTPILVVQQREVIDAKQTEIAELVQQATNMDNDGIGANDRDIPGMLALIESRKADLANEQALYESLRAEHRSAVLEVQGRLDSHREKRPDLFTANATAAEDVHQFARFGEDLAVMLPFVEDSEAATNWVVTLMALCLLLLNYGCAAALKGAFLLKELEDEAEAAAMVEDPVEPEKLDEVDIIDFPLPDERNQRKTLARAFIQLGALDCDSASVSSMTSRQLSQAVDTGLTNLISFIRQPQRHAA